MDVVEGNTSVLWNTFVIKYGHNETGGPRQSAPTVGFEIVLICPMYWFLNMVKFNAIVPKQNYVRASGEGLTHLP